MRVLFAALALAALPAAANAQLMLIKPADLNKDGVVTEDEQHEYDGRQAIQYRDAPPLYSPTAPPSGGETSFTIGPGQPEPGSLETRAVEASGFEQALDAKVREAERD